MKKSYLILIISILLSSCSKDVLDRTVFIPDEKDSNLPAYTEWGYNTFGSEYERGYFLASPYIIPCKIVYVDSYLQILFNGITSNGKEMGMVFIFPAAEMRDYADLIQLHNTAIDLAMADCKVKIILDGTETVLDIINGNLYFKRVQLLSVDEELNRAILSGTFEMQFLQNGFPSTISDGRFDLGITNDIFAFY